MSATPEDDRDSGWSECLPPTPAVGTSVPTICGGMLTYCANTPCAMHNGQLVFFCLATCKEEFDRNPKTSCLMVGPYRILK